MRSISKFLSDERGLETVEYAIIAGLIVSGLVAIIVAIGGWLDRVTDGNRCYLAVEEQLLVSSIMRAFPAEFAEHIERHGCPLPGGRPMPKLLDLTDGKATYDEAFWRKRPDWTYDPA